MIYHPKTSVDRIPAARACRTVCEAVHALATMSMRAPRLATGRFLRDLGHVAALLEVLDPALDLLDLSAHGGELALYQKRVLHVVGPVLDRSGSVCSAASRFRSSNCKSTYSSVTSFLRRCRW